MDLILKIIKNNFLVKLIVEKEFRGRQDSNLRGETPLDFESNALTTRPRPLLTTYGAQLLYSYSPFCHFKNTSV